MTVRGALTLLDGFTSVHGDGTSLLISSRMPKRGWLTNWTRTQAGSLFDEAVEVGHFPIQGTERRVFVLYSFGSESVVEFGVLAEVIYTELRNLGWMVSPVC